MKQEIIIRKKKTIRQTKKKKSYMNTETSDEPEIKTEKGFLNIKGKHLHMNFKDFTV
jgi:hypothetical protein